MRTTFVSHKLLPHQMLSHFRHNAALRQLRGCDRLPIITAYDDEAYPKDATRHIEDGRKWIHLSELVCLTYGQQTGQGCQGKTSGNDATHTWEAIGQQRINCWTKAGHAAPISRLPACEYHVTAGQTSRSGRSWLLRQAVLFCPLAYATCYLVVTLCKRP